MSKSKKNAKNNRTDGTQNAQNNMSYAQDKKNGSDATNCDNNKTENKNETNCQ